MKWKEQYSIGIQEIDQQHKKLLDFFSQLEHAIEGKAKWTDVILTVYELKNYATFHFEFEEALLRMYGLAGLEDHAQEHQSFFRNFDELERRSPDYVVAEDMMAFLENWLVHHILSTDRGYATQLLAGAPLVVV
ncbi:MAG: bacteriohemerythrin [Sterolibacterium sp.]